jgi:hypothetical protein
MKYIFLSLWRVQPLLSWEGELRMRQVLCFFQGESPPPTTKYVSTPFMGLFSSPLLYNYIPLYLILFYPLINLTILLFCHCIFYLIYFYSSLFILFYYKFVLFIHLFILTLFFVSFFLLLTALLLFDIAHSSHHTIHSHFISPQAPV